MSPEDGHQIAKENGNGMHYEEPVYAFELNKHIFHTGRMDSKSRWIDHTFYFAKDLRDVDRRKVAAEKTPDKRMDAGK